MDSTSRPAGTSSIKQVVRAETAQALDAARQALAGVLGPPGALESPLYVQLASGLYACMARPRKHVAPFNSSSVIGERQRQIGVEASTLFQRRTDPRWYLMPSKSTTTGLVEPGAGLTPPVTPPVLIAGGSGGLVEAVNAGTFEMRPVFVVTGPCVGPRITNVSLPGAPSIAFNLTLNSGDTLTIDTDFQSVVLVSAGSSVGSSRRSTEKAGNTWFNFPANSTNVVQLSSEDVTKVAGTLTVQWASAYMGI